MFELEGDQFDLSAIEKFAKDDNKTVEEYISTYGLTEVEPGKTTPTAPGAVVEETAAPKSQNTESTSENTFSDLQSPDNQYDFADLEFTNSLLDPSADKFEVIKNRYFMNTADVMKGATTQAKKEAKESQISNLNKKFKEGEFKKDEKLAFLDFQKTGKINPDLLPDPYIRKINPDTLEPYTGEEILNNVFENFGPALMSQLEAIKASSIDWLSKAAGPDAADFIVNFDLGKGGIEKENNKYYYKLNDGSKQEIGVEATNKQKEYIDNYIKLQNSMQYAGDIVEGFEKGDIGATVAGIANAVSGAVQTIVPALATGGASIYPQIAGPMILDYNIEKANRLYPDDSNAINKLINNNQFELGTPGAMALFSAGLEKIGIVGLKEAMELKKGLAGSLIRTLWATGKEGATGLGQFLTEETNLGIAKGQTLKEALKETKNKVLTKEALEATLQEAFGGGIFSVAGRGVKRTRKALSAVRTPTDLQAIEKDIEELSALKIQYAQATDKIVSDGIQAKINEVNSRLSSRVTRSNSIISKLNIAELDEIENLNDLATTQIARVKTLNEKFDKNEISEEDYKVALEGYKATYIDAKNRIKGIADTAETKPEQVVAEEVDTQEQTAPLTEAEQAIQKIITKEKIASSKVQQIYNDKGVEGINEIFNEFKPIVDRIVDKRRDAPNFDRELLTSEIQVGKRGILDLVRAYPKYVEKQEATNQPVAPLAGFINKQLPNRAIEASQRILGKEFTQDVTEAKAVTATETAEDVVTQQEQVKQEVKTALAKDLNLDEATQNDIVKAVEKTLGTKLPAVTDKKFKQALTTGFRNELTNTFKTVFGRQASYEQFLRDNFEKIYPAIPQETINRNFKEFNEAVVDPKTGKQLREKTAEGKKVFKKKDISKAEFVKYFLNAPGNVKGARKTSLAKVLADEIGLDNVLNALSKEDIKNKFVAVQELQGQEVPANFIEIISEKIDRAIDYIDKWQKSSELRADVGLALAAEFLKKVLQSIRLSIKAGLSITKAIKKAVDEASKVFKDAPTKNEKAEYAKEISLSISKYEDIDTLNIDDLMDQLSRIYYKNKGIQEEQNVILSLLDASKKSKLIKVLSKKPAGSNSKGFDVEFEVGGQKINVEVKASDAQYSSMTANFDLNSQEFTLSQQTKFNDLINKELESVKKSISEYAKEADSKVWPAKISKEKYNELGSSGKNIQKNISKTFEVPYELINELYNKKGINYINIAGKGLYYLGKDIYNLGVPKFNPNASATIRVARTATKKGDVTTTTRIFPKIDYKSLEKSPYNLNDTQSVINLFENTKKTSPQTLNEDFNKIIENKTGIAADKVYKKAKAEVVGASKGKWKFFIPPGAEDFVGLLYATLGKGKLGDQQMAWYKYNLLNPYTDALNNITRDRVQLAKDFKELKKQLKIVPKNLRKKLPGTQYSQQDAVRVYIWNKQGVDMLTEENGMDKADLDQLVEFVEKDPNLLKFADQLMEITQQEYAEPGAKWWNAGSIDADLLKTLSTTRRAKYLEESGWTENVSAIFSKENLNKLEAAYGKPYRIALENILGRMKSGRNRSFGGDALTSRFTDWISNSIGTIMFLNSRSAVLQTISAVNFINWSDNNVLAAAKAFANPKQWTKDFMMLMNSPFLVERRNGLKIDVNESEIADLAKTSTNKAKAIMGQLLKAGFLPTQIADSFAIASGGASFYRNRFNSLVKEGYTKEEAETIAMRDFRETATESQQSSDPSRISQQQAGPLGRIILAFANTPAQYARLTKKAVLDIKNGRGDLKTNVSKIIYYMVVQNIIFTALQQALFAVAFGDDEEEDEMNKKYIRMANSMSDSILRGLGFAGAAVSVAKNVAIKIAQESDKKSPKFEEAAWKLLEISPPISSKISKFRSAGRQISWNRKEIREKGLSLENPAAMAGAQIIAGATNLPVDRALRKIDNVQNALSEDAETWQRVALLSGWQDWEIGMKEKKKEKPKGRTKVIREKVKRERVKREKVKREKIN